MGFRSEPNALEPNCGTRLLGGWRTNWSLGSAGFSLLGVGWC
ncbi:hypothetical protein LINPERHAP1_LOCUS7898 [Linum perenne]